MIKTYLVPVTDALVEVLKDEPGHQFLKVSTCLSGLTNGEVFTKIYKGFKIYDESDTHVSVCMESGNIVDFPRNWWNAKWGE